MLLIQIYTAKVGSKIAALLHCFRNLFSVYIFNYFLDSISYFVPQTVPCLPCVYDDVSHGGTHPLEHLHESAGETVSTSILFHRRITSDYHHSQVYNNPLPPCNVSSQTITKLDTCLN